MQAKTQIRNSSSITRDHDVHTRRSINQPVLVFAFNALAHLFCTVWGARIATLFRQKVQNRPSALKVKSRASGPGWLIDLIAVGTLHGTARLHRGPRVIQCDPAAAEAVPVLGPAAALGQRAARFLFYFYNRVCLSAEHIDMLVFLPVVHACILCLRCRHPKCLSILTQ